MKKQANHVEKLLQSSAKDMEKAKMMDSLTNDFNGRLGFPDLDYRFFVHDDLYGTIANVKFGDPYPPASKCTWNELIALVKTLPACDLMLHELGGTSIVAKKWTESFSEKYLDRVKIYDIAPLYFHIDAFQGPQLSARWITKTQYGLVECKVFLGPSPDSFCGYEYVTKNRVSKTKNSAIKNYDRPRLHIEDTSIMDDIGNCVALMESPIYWSTAGTRSSDITLYYSHIGDYESAELGLQIAQYVAKIIAKNEKK